MQRNSMVLAAVAAMAAGGCAVDIPLTAPANPEGLYVATKARLGLDAIAYRADVDDELATTAVHPDDVGMFTGATKANPDNFDLDQLNIAPAAGLFASVGTRALRLFGGVTGRLNLLYFSRDGYRKGIHDTRQQASDPRPGAVGSFVFTQVNPGIVGLIPSAGLEANLGKLRLTAEVGFPYQRWEFRSGHDRWGRWQTVQSGSWTGLGIRYGGALGYRFNHSLDLFAAAFYESYDTSFGAVEGVGGVVGFVVTP